MDMYMRPRDYERPEWSCLTFMTTNIFNRLLEHVKYLPKELRHLIYRFITGWASANQWPQTKVKPGNLINFARRNKTPLYEKIIIFRTSVRIPLTNNHTSRPEHVYGEFWRARLLQGDRV